MAFFGLTALGPQNSFLSAAKSFRNLQIFDEDDFINAWVKVNRSVDNKFCDSVKLGEMMRSMFRGPVPPNDNACIVQAFEEAAATSELPGKISFQVYVNLMMKLAAEAEAEEEKANATPLPTCEYLSNSLLQDDLKRNRTFKMNPQQKLNTALTCSQEYGWEDGELKGRTRKARVASEITKFAAELIKNGVYY